jgi:hypothetical protein
MQQVQKVVLFLQMGNLTAGECGNSMREKTHYALCRKRINIKAKS